MVLVTAPRRRERIGTSILEACCVEVARRGLVSVLDATPAGERIYRPLGFEGMFNLSRWQGVAERSRQSARRHSCDGCRRYSRCYSDRCRCLRRQTRKFLVENLFRRLPQLAFVTARPSRLRVGATRPIATQIGPIVAANEGAAATLLDAALGCVSGPVFLDLIDGRDILMHRLRQRGFTVQRPFLRMGLNRRVPFGRPDAPVRRRWP